MPKFTVETTYHLPVYRQRTYDADTLEEACRLAIDDDGWSDEKSDVDTSGETYVSGIWQGDDVAVRGTVLPIPSQFDETIQRKAAHFEVLLGVLKILANGESLRPSDRSYWLMKAEAAVGKAEAILAGASDPEGDPRDIGHASPDLATAPGFGIHVLLRLGEENVRTQIAQLIEADETLTTITADAVTAADIRAGCLVTVERTDLTEEQGSAVFKAALAAIRHAEERLVPAS